MYILCALGTHFSTFFLGWRVSLAVSSRTVTALLQVCYEMGGCADGLHLYRRCTCRLSSPKIAYVLMENVVLRLHHPTSSDGSEVCAVRWWN